MGLIHPFTHTLTIKPIHTYLNMYNQHSYPTMHTYLPQYSALFYSIRHTQPCTFIQCHDDIPQSPQFPPFVCSFFLFVFLVPVFNVSKGLVNFRRHLQMKNQFQDETLCKLYYRYNCLSLRILQLIMLGKVQVFKKIMPLATKKPLRWKINC